MEKTKREKTNAFVLRVSTILCKSFIFMYGGRYYKFSINPFSFSVHFNSEAPKCWHPAAQLETAFSRLSAVRCGSLAELWPAESERTWSVPLRGCAPERNGTLSFVSSLPPPPGWKQT